MVAAAERADLIPDALVIELADAIHDAQALVPVVQVVALALQRNAEQAFAVRADRLVVRGNRRERALRSPNESCRENPAIDRSQHCAHCAHAAADADADGPPMIAPRVGITEPTVAPFRDARPA